MWRLAMMKGKDGNSLKGRRVYWTWLVSYLLVLVLLLGVWLGNMSFSRSIIIRQARQLNTSRMTLLQTMADAAVKQATSVTLSADTGFAHQAPAARAAAHHTPGHAGRARQH